MTEPDKKTQVRMPADVHELLTERAKQNDRSMNAELVRILKEVLMGTAERQPKHIRTVSINANP